MTGEEERQAEQRRFLQRAAAARHALRDSEAAPTPEPVLRPAAAAHALRLLEERFPGIEAAMDKAVEAAEAAAALTVAQDAEAPRSLLQRLQQEQNDKQFAFRRALDQFEPDGADLTKIVTTYARLAEVAAGG